MGDINATQMRDALAWATNDQRAEEDTPANPWEWFWQAIQGDFNEDRSTGQIVVDAAISMIPLVDQICDVRDLIANCKKLRQDVSDKWAWIALALTLIGLFPFLGSFVKGVLKVFFAFVRRADDGAVGAAVDGAMTWVITLMRRQSFQRYLRDHNVDEVFSWLAKEIKDVRRKVTATELLKSFDMAIRTIDVMVKKVDHVPVVGAKAKEAFETILWVRSKAKEGIADVTKTIDSYFEATILRLERQTLLNRHGIVNVNNVHYRGALPEAAAVSLMRNRRTSPSWLSEGAKPRWPVANAKKIRSEIAPQVKAGWPDLDERNIESFHKLAPATIKGPARLYRIVSPNSRAMGDCWISEKVFKEIQNSPDPRAAWRKHLAVWPDWNVNGQFVTYDVQPNEILKVWRGPAASQTKDCLPGRYLEGGGEQIVFNVARTDPRNDVMRYYMLKGGKKNILRDAITQSEFDKLSDVQRKEYVGIREAINHPHISGPFETGWGYTDFEGEGFAGKVGLPSLSGQATALQR